MSDKEAKLLLRKLKTSSEPAAIAVIKYIGIGFKTMNGRKRPVYSWIKHNRDESAAERQMESS